jgi:uncharacterized protein YwqG
MLRQLIAQFRVEKLEPWILRHVAECILLHVESRTEVGRIGNSRIGGPPDLPRAFEWPRRPDGKFLNFVMQVDLTQLPVSQCKELPELGRLYIFVGDDENSSNVEHKVIYDKSSSQTLAPTQQPDPSQLASDHLLDLMPHAIGSELTLSLPETVVSEQWRDRDVDIDDEVWDSYSELRQSLRPAQGEPPSQLLGYPSFFGDDPARTAFYTAAGRLNVERETLESIEASLKEWEADGNALSIATCRKRKDDFLWYQAHREEVESRVKEWRLLVQIQSNAHVGLWWWDAGSVQIMIRQPDLQVAQFDKTQMTLFSN